MGGSLPGPPYRVAAYDGPRLRWRSRPWDSGCDFRDLPQVPASDADWRLARAAAALGSTEEELVRRIRAAGFERLLKAHVQRRNPR